MDLISLLFDIVIAIFEKFSFYSYKILDHYLISNVLAFARGFELAIILLISIVFLLLAIGVTLRQAKKLPKSYYIEIIDLDGRQMSVEVLRQEFSTYDAAESFARNYQETYSHQYRFKVIGSMKSLDI